LHIKLQFSSKFIIQKKLYKIRPQAGEREKDRANEMDRYSFLRRTLKKTAATELLDGKISHSNYK